MSALPPSRSRRTPTRQDPWRGFEPPRANVLYCPNQFFDVVLPQFSRGVVRLVAYLLWKTLAWNDAQGRPRCTQHPLTWEDLVAAARISRGALSAALGEAEQAGLVTRRRDPAGASPLALHWQAGGPYVRERAAFRGFYGGVGHRTYVPNQFFTVVIAQESLALSRVVGAVVRQSIGFEATRGVRRREAALSLTALQRATHLNRRHVVQAVQEALARQYLQRLDAGRFGGRTRAARYALQWADAGGGELPPVSIRSSERGAEAVQKGNQRQFKKGTCLYEEIKLGNKNTRPPPHRQVLRAGPAVTVPRAAAAGDARGTDRDRVSARLQGLGFRGSGLVALSGFSLDAIERQVAWLSQRSPARNPLGMLRRAIEEDWPAPRRDRAGETEASGALAAATAAAQAPSGGDTTRASPDAAEHTQYRAAMQVALAAFETDQPERFAAFGAFRAQLRRQLHFLHHDNPDHGILKHWEGAATRLAHWRSFDPAVPDFETWRRQRVPLDGAER